MKRLQSLLSTAIVLSSLTAFGCSTTNIPNSPIESKTPAIVASNTEKTELSVQESNELKAIMQSEKFEDNSFSIKTEQQGKDVAIDMFLFNPKAASRAKFWGLKTADKLLNAGTSPRKRWFLERKLGGLFPSDAFKVQVLVWVERADLLRIKDVSVDDSFLLVMSGVTSVPHLARFNNPIDQAALKVQLSLLAFQYGLPIPSFDEVKGWTQESTTLSPLIY